MISFRFWNYVLLSTTSTSSFSTRSLSKGSVCICSIKYSSWLSYRATEFTICFFRLEDYGFVRPNINQCFLDGSNELLFSPST
jgi:hypothetical protein